MFLFFLPLYLSSSSSSFFFLILYLNCINLMPRIRDSFFRFKNGLDVEKERMHQELGRESIKLLRIGIKREKVHDKRLTGS